MTSAWKVDGILRITSATQADKGAADLVKLASRVQGVDKQLGRLAELVDARCSTSAARRPGSCSSGWRTSIWPRWLRRWPSGSGRPRLRRLFAVGGGSRPDGHQDGDSWALGSASPNKVITNFLSNAIEVRRREADPDSRLGDQDPWPRSRSRITGSLLTRRPAAALRAVAARIISPKHYGGFGLGLWIVKLAGRGEGRGRSPSPAPSAQARISARSCRARRRRAWGSTRRDRLPGLPADGARRRR